MSDPVESRHFNDILEQQHRFRDWTIITRSSHILESKCSKSCHSELPSKDKCLYCQFADQLSDLPHFPDMTFAKNLLQLKHKDGFGLEFDCLNALKSISTNFSQNTKVDVSEEWMKARTGCEFTKKVLNPFDWTFTTSYQGHFISDNHEKTFRVEPTSERIDIERLKVKEEILFFDDIHLFEDELADNGVAQCSVKIRVMKGMFYILLRFFLRVDKVKVKLNDTRIFYEVERNYMLREFTSREEDLTKHRLPTEVLIDPVKLSSRLPIKEIRNEKLIFPQ